MASKHYAIDIEIHASKKTVWTIVSEVEAWPTWTPTMTTVQRLSGSGVGAQYAVKQPHLPKSKLCIDTWNEGDSFSWHSNETATRMDADHKLTELSPNLTRVNLTLVMSGPMIGVVWLIWGRKIRSYVDIEAKSLKAVAESRS